MYKVLSIILLSLLLSHCSGQKKKEQPLTLTQSESRTANTKKPRSLQSESKQGLEQEAQGLYRVNDGYPQGARIAEFVRIPGGGLLMSTEDAGLFRFDTETQRWEQIGDELPNPKINALHSDGELIYAGVYQAGLYVSRDRGESWESWNADLPDLRVQSVLRHEDLLFVGTDTGLFQRNEENGNWISVYPGTQVNHLLGFYNQIFASTQEGLLMSQNQGESWLKMLQKGAVKKTELFNRKMIAYLLNGDKYVSWNAGFNWTQGSPELMDEISLYVGGKDKEKQLPPSVFLPDESLKNAPWQQEFSLPQQVIFGLMGVDVWLYRSPKGKDGC